MLSLPTWIVHYAKRRPSLVAPLTGRDYEELEVGAKDRDGAAAAFNQRMPAQCSIVSIRLGGALGPS